MRPNKSRMPQWERNSIASGLMTMGISLQRKGILIPALARRCCVRAGDTAAGQLVPQQELYLRVDTAQLALGEALDFGPDDRIEPEQKGFLLGHD